MLQPLDILFGCPGLNNPAKNSFQIMVHIPKQLLRSNHQKMTVLSHLPSRCKPQVKTAICRGCSS